MSDASPLSEILKLSFDSTLLSPLLFFCLLLLRFLSYLITLSASFFSLVAISPELKKKKSVIFFITR